MMRAGPKARPAAGFIVVNEWGVMRPNGIGGYYSYGHRVIGQLFRTRKEAEIVRDYERALYTGIADNSRGYPAEQEWREKARQCNVVRLAYYDDMVPDVERERTDIRIDKS